VQLRFGWPYFAGIAAGVAIAAWHFTLVRERTRDGCFRAFRVNHWLGFAIFAGVLIDRMLASL